MTVMDARRLGGLGANPDCATRPLPIDYDRALTGTTHDPGFGQSQAAFAAGRRFEVACAGPTEDYAELLAALKTAGLDVGSGAVERIPDGLTEAQADKRTRRLITNMVAGTVNVALIAQATMGFTFAGRRTHLRPDAIAFVAVHGHLVVADLKGFKLRAGRWPGDKMASALNQIAVYQTCLRRLLADLGLDPALVDDRAVVVCSTGLGMTPTATIHDNSDRRRTLEVRLAHAEPRWRTSPAVATASTALADPDPVARLAAFAALAAAEGTAYKPSCMNHCGGWRWCREQAADDLARLGTPRLLSVAGSLRRNVDLARGAAPTPAEAAAAEHLRSLAALSTAARRAVP
jgi:hypothetical protein